MAWVDVDLSTAVFKTYAGSTYGQWDGTVIKTGPDGSPSFYFPDVVFDDAVTYEIELTYTVAEAGNAFNLIRYLDQSEGEWAGGTLYYVISETHSDDVHTVTVGPGVGSWDAAASTGYDAFVWDIGVTDQLSAIRYRVVSDLDLTTAVCFEHCEVSGDEIVCVGSTSITRSMKFSIPAVVLETGETFTVEMDVATDSSPSVAAYSITAPEYSAWLASDEFIVSDPEEYVSSGLTTYSFEFGPGVTDYETAIVDGETYVVWYVQRFANDDTRIVAMRTSGTVPEVVVAGLVGNRADAIDIDGGAAVRYEPPVVGRPALVPAGGADVVVRAITDLDDTEGFYRPEFTEVRRPRHRTRIVAGGKDWTFEGDIPTPAIDYQYVIPLGYGPATMQVPQFDGRFDSVADARWKRIREQKIVKSQRVDDDPSSGTYGDVVATDWVGVVVAQNRDDRALTLELGGEAEGRASMIWHPRPIITRVRDAGTQLYNSIVGKLGLRMTPRLPYVGINLASRGAMWEDEYLQEVTGLLVDRDTGAQWTVMPDEVTGAYVASQKDYETIHWTVYIDGELTTASLRTDLSERFNRVWADAVAPDGHHINFAIAPRILRGSVPPYPFDDESNFGIGATDEDTDSGDGITALIWRLTHIGALHRADQPGGFDEDVEAAINEVRAAAGLEESGEVSPHLWNDILFDNAATGYSDNWAHLRPAVQRSKTEKFLRTGSGAIIGKNPDYDRHELKRDTAISLGRVPSTRRVLNVAREQLAPLGERDWVGEITLRGGVILGEHNPGDPLTAALIREPQDVKAGHNIWVPNFEGGTLFQVGHNSITDNGRQGRILVDTRGRDTVNLSMVWERARETRAALHRGRGGRRRASMQTSDIVTPWDRFSGQTDRDWDLAGGEWTEVVVPSGSAGTLNDIDIRLADAMKFAVIVSPKQLPLSRLNRKVDPLAEVDPDAIPWFGDEDIERWLRQEKGAIYSAGWYHQPCGFGSYVENTGAGPSGKAVTGEHFDTAGVEYGPTREACLFLYLWVGTDTTLPRQQVFHQQLSGV